MGSVAGSALIAVVVSFGVAATLYKIISLNRKPVKPVEYGRTWFAWAVLFVTIVMFQSFVIHPNINTFMVWLGVGVFGYGGIAFIIGVLFGSFKERQMKNKTNANVEKTGNTQNMSKSDNASEIVSKPFKTKIIKQDSDMENTIGDEELYLTATKEVEGKDLDEALWAKCLAIFKGDEKKAKYDYIEKRVAILRQEEVDRIAEEERIAREKMEEDERIAEEKIETERKKKLAKEMEVIEKARKRQQEIKEKEWAAVQKKNEEKQRIRQARDKRIGDAIENFLKKRWKLLIAIILVVIAYDLITPDDPKTKKTPVKNNSQSKIDINAVDINTNKIVENIELNDVAISSDTKKVLEEIIVNTSRPKELIEEKIIIDKDKTEKHSSKLSAEEQYNIGIKYFDKDTEEDYTKSFGYFEESAEKGYIESQYYLAHLYYTGNGVPKNNLKAGNWYEKAANQGHIESQYILGTMFETLHIVTQDNNDYESAAYWYKKAADQGHSTAQYYLGNMYATGRGVSKNNKTAEYWYLKAANQGHSTAQYNLGKMYRYGKGDEILQDYDETIFWYRQAAKQGHYMSILYLEDLLIDIGRNTSKDDSNILEWLKKSANSGKHEAQEDLAVRYFNGNGVDKNLDEAKRWFKKASDQGNQSAKNYLNIIESNQ